MDARRRHERLQELLLVARELALNERESYLGEACGGDAELRCEIDQLLAHDQNPLDLVEALSADEKGSRALRAKLDLLWDSSADEREQGGASGEAAELAPRSIGRFRILRTLGEGGMGIVYEAEQDHPRRIVALKVLRTALLSPGALRRFEHECELLGRLQHPGIAQIFDSGRAETAHGALPYLAMQRISGEPLTEYAEQRALPLRDRLELFARVADAVQHAHDNGVIHRDLKPANILVDASGAPKILDFGIARAIDADIQLTTMHTGTGQILGTLAYMSPEQAAGEPEGIDARADVYALGVLLYELLCGRLPYDVSKKSLSDAVHVIREVVPRRLSAISSALRGDVETIVRKALEKEKDRRYFSAAELAADLRRVLRDEPIRARPPSGLYLLRKLVQRHKTFFAAVATVFVALVAGLVASLHFAFAADAQRRAAEREAYRANLTATVQALRAGNFAAARAAHESAPEHLRAWEWQHLARTWVQELARITLPGVAAAVFLDETRILAAGAEGEIYVWDALTGETRHVDAWPAGKRFLALSEDGGLLLAFAEGSLFLGDPLGAEPPRVLPFAEGSPKERRGTAAIATGGARLAVTTATDEVLLVDPTTEARMPIGPFGDEVLALRFGAGGSRLGVQASGGALHVWDAKRDKPFELGGEGLAFAPDGTTLVLETKTVHGAGAALYFKDAGCKTIRRLSRNDYGAFHFEPAVALAYSSDQRLLAVAFLDGDIHLVDAEAGDPWPPPSTPRTPRSGSAIGIVHHEGEGILDIAFSPEGSSLLSLRNGDRTLRIWSTGASGAQTVCRGHEEDVYAVACSPDGATVASSGWDYTIRFWDTTLRQEIATLPAGGRGRCLAFSPDGRRLACGTDHGLVVMDLRTSRILAEPTTTAINAVAFSPDGSLLAAATNDPRVHLWSTTTFDEPEVVLAGDSTAQALAFDAGGTLLATGYANSELRLWDPRSGREIARAREAHRGGTFYPGARSLAFAPDGSRLLVGWGDAAITQMDVPSLRPIASMLDHRGEVFTVAYSPDGTRIASGGRDGLLRLWEADTGSLLVQLRGHEDYIFSLVFSPDGRRIATGSGDWTVRIWDSEPVRTSWSSQGRIARARPAAERLVAGLMNELGDATAILARLEQDPSLDPVLRRLALQVVLRGEVEKSSANGGR